jgi:hypothetical protein
MYLYGENNSGAGSHFESVKNLGGAKVYIRLAPTMASADPTGKCLKPPANEDCEWKGRCVRQAHFKGDNHQDSKISTCLGSHSATDCQSYLRKDNYPFCQYHHPSSDDTKGACQPHQNVWTDRTVIAKCGEIKSAAQCSKELYPAKDYTMCTWYMGPRLAANRKRCTHSSRLLIKPAYTSSFTDCDKTCSEHSLCASFFYGRADAGA